jgi:hypothetical protein
VDRYSFIVVDLHHLLLAGLPAHFESYHPSQAVWLLPVISADGKAVGRRPSHSHEAVEAFRRCSIVLAALVPAAEIEALVITALRNHLGASGAGEQLPAPLKRAVTERLAPRRRSRL